jgi:hypothetical protein
VAVPLIVTRLPSGRVPEPVKGTVFVWARTAPVSKRLAAVSVALLAVRRFIRLTLFMEHRRRDLSDSSRREYSPP